MKKDRIAFILSLAVLLVCTGLTHASAKPMINNIRFESPTATEDRIIFELNGPHLPTGKALPGDNPRVYFDFLDTIPANKIKTRMPANGNFVRQIRYAYHKGEQSKTRVVFDLVANQKMDFRQDFDKDTNTLVITLYIAGTEPEAKTAAMPEPEPAIQEAPAEVAMPEPEPEPVVMPEPEPEPAVAIPEPEPTVVPPTPEPEPVAIDEPAEPETPSEDAGKTIHPIEDVSITVADEPEEVAPKPEPVMQDPPAEVVMPEPEPVAVPEPEPEPVPQEELPQITSIPPSTMAVDSLEPPVEETTVIQPMSEIGIQPTDRIESEAPVLHSIEFDPKSNRGEIISFKLNGFHPPVVFGIEEDIPRIVCFFKNTTAAREVKDMLGTRGRFVRNIKVGKYENPDNIRVVLELVPGNNYDLQQIFFKDDKIFMMIINRAGKQISTESN